MVNIVFYGTNIHFKTFKYLSILYKSLPKSTKHEIDIFYALFFPKHRETFSKDVGKLLTIYPVFQDAFFISLPFHFHEMWINPPKDQRCILRPV